MTKYQTNTAVADSSISSRMEQLSWHVNNDWRTECSTSSADYGIDQNGEESDAALRVAFSKSVIQSPTLDINRIEPAQTIRDLRGRRTIRRLNGFLIGFDGEEASVMLFDKGNKYEYILPARMLKEADVTVENQPFQLDEYESSPRKGVYEAGTLITALADSSTCRVLALAVDDETKELRNLVLGYEPRVDD